jgi:BirA family transcriptional regulator, biotin operon repressor / biotin---[acetyl-CoA-carboxylase] ligase
MNQAMRVLQVLAESRASEDRARRFVSGADLAAQFHVTRAAIWKSIRVLRGMGTEIEAIPRLGYRLALPSSPLDAARVGKLLPADVASRLRRGECEGALESTNSTLLARGAPPPGQFDFLTAEYQSAGRGRRGRSWLAPPGSAICLSWSWCFEAMAAHMGALSLAVGVAALRALDQCDVDGVQLKWPNDLVTPAGKLGGILIEMRSESAGPVQVVVGIGLNLALGKAVREHIDATGNTATDLHSLTTRSVTRNELVAALLTQGIAAMQQFGRQGLAPFLNEYRAADALRDRPIALQGAHATVTSAVARGLDTDGALLAEHGGRMHRIIAGEVSVRTDKS